MSGTVDARRVAGDAGGLSAYLFNLSPLASASLVLSGMPRDRKPGHPSVVARLSLVTLLAGSVLLPPLLAGCSGATARPVTSESRAGGVTVMLNEVDGDIFKLTVINSSNASLVVFRDRFYLRGSDGVHAREAGGAASVYTIPPGGVHGVNVKFRLEGPPGTRLELDFADAIRTGDGPLRLPPIECVVQ